MIEVSASRAEAVVGEESGELRWVRVAECWQIPLREGRAAMVYGREIAIFNLGDRWLASDNRCPHQGGPLCDGIVTGASVVCPLHAWKVNLERGEVERPSSSSAGCVRTYRTRVEDGVVLVRVPAAPRPGAQPGMPSAASGEIRSNETESRSTS